MALSVVGLTMGMALPATVHAQQESKPQQVKKAAAGKAVKKASPAVAKIQAALKKAGFDPGPIDGVAGRKTRAAVMAFQKANGLKADGRVGKMTQAKLQSFMEQ